MGSDTYMENLCKAYSSPGNSSGVSFLLKFTFYLSYYLEYCNGTAENSKGRISSMLIKGDPGIILAFKNRL